MHVYQIKDDEIIDKLTEVSECRKLPSWTRKKCCRNNPLTNKTKEYSLNSISWLSRNGKLKDITGLMNGKKTMTTSNNCYH